MDSDNSETQSTVGSTVDNRWIIRPYISSAIAKIMWIKASAEFKLLGRATCMQYQAKHTTMSSIIC